MARKIAILGDIHANIDALSVVLRDCQEQGVTEYLCTGDVVGYNACPHECLAWIRELGCPVVKGNHDHYVASEQNLEDFNPAAAAVVEWTRDQLDAEEIAWLRDLPFSVTDKRITIVHSTMDRPENFGYVFDHQQAETNFIQQKTPICFHGHTHCPMIYEKQMNGIYRIDPQDIQLKPGRKYFINVGSVGQPRDGDPRASFAIFDSDERQVTLHRVEYDIAEAQRRILAAGLPQRLADRLAQGR